MEICKSINSTSSTVILIPSRDESAIGGEPKPEPDIYLKAIKDNDLNKNQTIIIEDSVVGVKAGVSSGVSTSLTTFDPSGPTFAPATG